MCSGSWPGSLLGAEIRSKCHTWLLLPLSFYPTEFMWMYCVLTLFALFVIAILVFQTVNNDYWRVVFPWKIWCIRSESCVHQTLRRGFCVFLFFQWCTSRVQVRTEVLCGWKQAQDLCGQEVYLSSHRSTVLSLTHAYWYVLYHVAFGVEMREFIPVWFIIIYR